MHKEALIRCENGHDVYELCRTAACIWPAQICNEETCKFSSNHKDCMKPVNVGDLL